MRRVLCMLLAAVLLLGGAGCGKTAASVTFFKAGKADAAVIRTEHAAVLVDTGLAKNADELIASLTALGVERIDVLILSHFDKDHVGGAAAVLSAFPVGAVYQSNYPKDSDEYAAYMEALTAAGLKAVTVLETQELTLDGLAIALDGPDEAVYDEDPSNNSSLVVTVTCGDDTILFAGDAEDARLAELLADFERPSGNVILKVPYHGHWQQMLPEFFAAVRPDTAVIPCGRNEPEDDELARTTELLEGLGAAVYLTRDGDVTLPLG